MPGQTLPLHGGAAPEAVLALDGPCGGIVGARRRRQDGGHGDAAAAAAVAAAVAAAPGTLREGRGRIRRLRRRAACTGPDPPGGRRAVRAVRAHPGGRGPASRALYTAAIVILYRNSAVKHDQLQVLLKGLCRKPRRPGRQDAPRDTPRRPAGLTREGPIGPPPPAFLAPQDHCRRRPPPRYGVWSVRPPYSFPPRIADGLAHAVGHAAARAFRQASSWRIGWGERPIWHRPRSPPRLAAGLGNHSGARPGPWRSTDSGAPAGRCPSMRAAGTRRRARGRPRRSRGEGGRRGGGARQGIVSRTDGRTAGPRGRGPAPNSPERRAARRVPGGRAAGLSHRACRQDLGMPKPAAAAACAGKRLVRRADLICIAEYAIDGRPGNPMPRRRQNGPLKQAASQPPCSIIPRRRPAWQGDMRPSI